MLSLRRMTDTPRFRELIVKRARNLANCWRGEHEYGFNPFFGTLQCIHCGKVSHADLRHELEKLLKAQEETDE